jgi:glycosyltransferase involved in cell wall biosynthesis
VPLRLAFDATALLGPRTGVGVVAAEVLTRLATTPDLDVTAFAVTWRGRAELAAAVPPGVRAVGRPMAARPLRRAWERLDNPPVEWWTGPVDVVHSPNYVVPPSRHGAELMSVHDLTFVHFPQLCTPDTLAYPPLIRRALRRGATVHTGSEFVADEIRHEFGLTPDRVVVVPYGVDQLAPDPDGADAAAGRRLAGGGPFILALGTVEPRKDLPSLVAAFDGLADAHPDLALVLAGPDGWGAEALSSAIAASPHRARIRRLGWVDDAAKTALLRGASVYAYPSVYEGFGLPPVEAMAAGTPVVTTSAGSLPEVVCDAALVVAPGDADALGQAIARLLDDPDLAERQRVAGLARSQRYSWDATTAGLVGLYRRLGDLHSAT